MKELLLEQLRYIMEALPDGMTFHAWYYDDACSFEVFDFDCPIQREAVSYAFGYLRGAHEALDVTLMDLLGEHDIDPDALSEKPKTRRKARKRKTAAL